MTYLLSLKVSTVIYFHDLTGFIIIVLFCSKDKRFFLNQASYTS
jgi:hypothetical protein